MHRGRRASTPLQGDACVQCAGHARVVAWCGRDTEQHTDGRLVSIGIPPQGVPSSVHKIIGIGHRRGECWEPSDENRCGSLWSSAAGVVSRGVSAGVWKCYHRAYSHSLIVLSTLATATRD